MTSARSMTRTLSSRSRLAPCTGLSSSSKMTSVAPDSATAAATSSTLPSPISVAGLGEAICWETRPTTSAPAVSTSRVSSSRCSVTCRRVLRPLARGGHEHGPFDRVANLNQCPDIGSSACGVTGWSGSAAAPARLSGARPSCVNGILRSPKGVSTVSWPLSVYGRSPAPSAARAAPARPVQVNRMGRVTRSCRPSAAEVAVVFDVAQVRILDVDAHLQPGAAQVEIVGIVDADDQVHRTAREPSPRTRRDRGAARGP